MTWRVKPSCNYIEWSICYKWPPEWYNDRNNEQLVRNLVKLPKGTTYRINPDLEKWLTACSAEWYIDLNTQDLIFKSREDYVQYLLEFLS